MLSALGVYVLWVPVGSDVPPSGVPQEVDLVGIAALVTSVGGFIGGIICSLIVVLKKPTGAQGKLTQRSSRGLEGSAAG